MKKLCLGTLLRLLSDTKKENTKQYNLLRTVLETVKSDVRFSDVNFQGGLLSGKYNLSDYKEISTCDKNELVRKIRDTVVPEFSEPSQRLIIVCARDILKNDPSIDDDDMIGYEDGYTKQDIISMQVFPFPDFLANVYYYVTTSLKNTPYKKEIKELTKDYVNGMKRYSNDIQLETKVTYKHSKVPLTLDPEPFNEVFTEIKNLDLHFPNPSNIRIYSLDVTNSKIDYEKIKGFISSNIGRYIYSRAMRNNYNLKKDSGDLTLKALRAYNKRIKEDPSTNHFNELFLYSFLECILRAPKIFSKMELQDKKGVYNSVSSGVHILSFRKGSLPFNQLVFGAADTTDSLECAVDNALKQVTEIKSSVSKEFDFLETTILNEEFDSDTNKALEEIIIPTKASGLKKPDSAFGIFLGYTVSVAAEPNNAQFKENLKQKMETDIVSISSYMTTKINELGLTSYSFYVYVLPLNNAVIDKDEIIKKALEVN